MNLSEECVLKIGNNEIKCVITEMTTSADVGGRMSTRIQLIGESGEDIQVDVMEESAQFTPSLYHPSTGLFEARPTSTRERGKELIL